MLRFLNWLVEWFGYEWVLDTQPYEPQARSPRDEDWDDLYQNNPRYRLQKKGRLNQG